MKSSEVVAKLKDSGDGSYKEVGTVGEDSRPVIWAKISDSSFPLEFSLVPDFSIEHNSGYGGYDVRVKCHAIFTQHVSLVRYGFSEDAGDFSKDILTRFKLGSYEEQYRVEQCTVLISEFYDESLSEDEVIVTIDPYGGMPDPCRSDGVFISIQVAKNFLKGFISSIQSSSNNVEATLNIKMDEHFYAGNVDGVMFNLVEGIEVGRGCYFSFKTGINSGHQMAEIIKKSSPMAAKQKRRQWTTFFIVIAVAIVTGLSVGMLSEWLFPQFTEWLN